MSGGITFDTGGLIALERNDRRVVAILARERERGAEIVVPATALAQALRVPARQVTIMRLLRQPRTATIALDRADASFAGQLLAATGTSDIVDAHVVICARRHNHGVVTSDGGDLRRLDASLALSEV